MTESAQSPLFQYLRKMLAGEVAPPPIARTLGIDLVSAEPGHVVMQMDVGPHLANPMGTLHGGVMCDIADAAMGMSFASLGKPGETFATLELKINFLRPVWKGRIRADARVVKSGKTIGLVECRVLTADDELVAHATSTCMTLRGEQAKGR